MKSKTQKTLSLLLSGKSSVYKKFAGKHVMVVRDKILPLKEGESARNDYKELEQKYKEPPVIVFVPRKDISYILLCK